MKSFLLLLNLLVVGISWGQCKKAELEIKYTDSSIVRTDTLYLYGVSNTPSRIFLDELYASMLEMLAKKNITLIYSYEGKYWRLNV